MQIVLLHHAVAEDAAADERDVLVQVAAVGQALQELGHQTFPLACEADLAPTRRRLLELRPDVVFNLVESLGGSDRQMHLAPALLETLNLPYTGSPPAALQLGNDKLGAKRLLQQAGLPTAPWQSLETPNPPEWDTSDTLPASHAAPALDTLPPFEPGETYILKTIYEHASFGIDDDGLIACHDRQSLLAAIEARQQKLHRPCFAERYIDGREFNISLLAGQGGPQTLPPAEIDFTRFPEDKPRIVGYQAKWDEDSFEYQHTPRRFADIHAEGPLLEQLQSLSLACWRLFGLRGWARVDFRVDRQGRPWILEVNANPCLSPDAGFAAALAEAGIPFSAAIARIVDDACRNEPSSAVFDL